ncbi:MAG: pyruvate synthase, partial [Clostridia bacterium]|nr:pyruvate synthase [Clostridia bacterium]
IAYAPCINHGINMGKAQAEIRKAVAAGYWPLYRYNPDNENPLTVDSKDPTESYQDFLRGEVRYTSLLKQFPEAAEKLFQDNESEAAKRLAMYKKLAAK